MSRCKHKDCAYRAYAAGGKWCSYANKKAGRETVLKTVCDLHGIPYKYSGTLGIKAMHEYDCPCYTPKAKRKRRDTAITISQSNRASRFDWEKAREMLSQGATDAKIAATLGCSDIAVYRWKKREKLLRARGAIYDWEKGRELYRKGLNDVQIAAGMGCSKEAVFSWRKREGLPANAQQSKFDWAKARELYDAGYTDSEIKKAINASGDTVGSWRRRCKLPPNVKEEQ